MFPYITRRMARVRNSTMSAQFRLNSLFHSEPVRGDYKLSKKNEILVDLFLKTLFHPPSLQPVLSSDPLCPFLSLFKNSPSSLPGHRSPPEGRSGQRPPDSALPSVRNPATKASAVVDLLLGGRLSPSPPVPPPSPPPLRPL